MRSLSTAARCTLAAISPCAQLALASCGGNTSRQVCRQPAADTSATVYLEIGQ